MPRTKDLKAPELGKVGSGTLNGMIFFCSYQKLEAAPLIWITSPPPSSPSPYVGQANDTKALFTQTCKTVMTLEPQLRTRKMQIPVVQS